MDKMAASSRVECQLMKINFFVKQQGLTILAVYCPTRIADSLHQDQIER